MTEELLALLPLYGTPVLALVTLLSCLALPVPSSLMMMAAGGFVAAGELSLFSALAAAYVGALLGDQIGFWIGRSRHAYVMKLESRDTRQARALSRATEMTRIHGIWAVFLTRWLLSPLGPYVNLAAGAARVKWRAFSLGSTTGEAVWVGTYTAIGAGAGQTLSLIWPMVSDVVGILVALAIAGLLILRARHLLQLAKAMPAKVKKKKAG